MPADVAVLPEVERIAGLVFKTYPGELGLTDGIYDSVNSVETFAEAQRAGHLWVAVAPGGVIVGLGFRVVDAAELSAAHIIPGRGIPALRDLCHDPQ